MVKIGFMALEISFENVDDTDGLRSKDACLYYKLSELADETSAQVS